MEHLILVLSLVIVLILGAWIWVLKRKVGILADQVSLLEVVQNSQSTSKKRVVEIGDDAATGGDDDNKPGIQTYTLE